MLVAELESQPISNPVLQAAQPSCRVASLPKGPSQVNSRKLFCHWSESAKQPRKIFMFNLKPVTELMCLKWHIQLWSWSQKYACVIKNDSVVFTASESNNLLSVRLRPAFTFSLPPLCFASLSRPNGIQTQLRWGIPMVQYFNYRKIMWEIHGKGSNSKGLVLLIVNQWFSISGALLS